VSAATTGEPRAPEGVDEISLGACGRYKLTSVEISHGPAPVFRILAVGSA
jgi:hypothetical protein